MTGETPERVEVFFYGLFMDEALLREKGLKPEDRRTARVENFSLVIGERATLVACEGGEVYGVLFSLTRAEVEALYSEESVSAYRPEVVSALTDEGRVAQALCFNLPTPPTPSPPYSPSNPLATLPRAIQQVAPAPFRQLALQSARKSRSPLRR